MSKTLLESNGVTLGTFAGGMERGMCVQITTSSGYVQLTMLQLATVFNFLKRCTDRTDLVESLRLGESLSGA